MFQSNDSPEYDYLYKIRLIGTTGVGKTNLLTRFARDEFSLETKSAIWIEYATKTLTIEDKTIKMQVWDSRGLDNHRLLGDRGTVGFFICYDITDEESFKKVQNYLKTVRENCPSNVVVMLIGNKSDQRHLRKVSTDQGRKFAEDNGLLFMETSALESTNVELAFRTLAQSIYQPVHIKTKDDPLREAIEPVVYFRNQILNPSLIAYQSQGKKFGFFEKSAARETTLRTLQAQLKPILDNGQISALTTDEKLTIARHFLTAINETQESHRQGSTFGYLGITSSRLAIALQTCLDRFLADNGLTMDEIVVVENSTENNHITI